MALSTDILHRINWVDILIVIVMLRTSYVAFQHGLSHEIFPLFGSIVMISLALRYYTTLSAIFEKYVLSLPPDVVRLLAFTAILFAAGFACKLIGGLVDIILKVTWHPFVEKFGGLLIGVVKASIVTCMVLTVLALIPLSYLQVSMRDRSLMGLRFLRIGPNIYAQVSRLLPPLKFEEAAPDKNELMRRLAENKSIDTGALQKAAAQLSR